MSRSPQRRLFGDNRPDAADTMYVDSATCRRIRMTIGQSLPPDPSIAAAFSPEAQRAMQPTESSRTRAFHQRHDREENDNSPERTRAPRATTPRSAARGLSKGASASAAHRTGSRASPRPSSSSTTGKAAALRERLVKLSTLQREPPRTLSELVVNLEAENTSLKGDFDDAVQSLEEMRASRDQFQVACVMATIAFVDVEITTRKQLYSFEADAWGALEMAAESLFSLMRSADEEQRRHDTELRAVLESAESAREAVESQHAIELAAARRRPATRAASCMTQLSLLSVADASAQHLTRAAAADGMSSIAHLVESVATLSEQSAGPSSIGLQVHGWELSRDVSNASTLCDIRPTAASVETQAGRTVEVATAATQTDAWRRVETVAILVKAHIAQLEAAVESAYVAKEGILDLLTRSPVKMRTRGTLCVTAGEFAELGRVDVVPPAAALEHAPRHALYTWAWDVDAGDGGAERLVASAVADTEQRHRGRLDASDAGSPRRQDHIARSASSRQEGHLEDVDLDAVITGEYVNPARQLDLLRAALSVAQASARRMALDHVRHRNAVRAAVADLAAQRTVARELQRSIEPLSDTVDQQAAILDGLADAIVPLDVGDGSPAVAVGGSQSPATSPRRTILESLAATPVGHASPPHQRHGRVPHQQTTSSASTGFQKRALSPDVGGGPDDGDDGAGSEDIGASPRNDAAPSAAEGVFEQAAAALQRAFSDVADSLAAATAHHQRSRPQQAPGVHSPPAWLTAALEQAVDQRLSVGEGRWVHELATSVAPKLLEQRAQLLNCLGDFERYAGLSSPQRRRWDGDDSSGSSAAAGRRRRPPVQLSEEAVDALQALLRCIDDLRQWLINSGGGGTELLSDARLAAHASHHHSAQHD